MDKNPLTMVKKQVDTDVFTAFFALIRVFFSHFSIVLFLCKSFIIVVASPLLTSCTTIERPHIETWQPPKWVPKKTLSTTQTTTTQTHPSSVPYEKAVPIKRNPSRYQKKTPAKPISQDPFWQRKISLNFEKISLKKALDGLSKSHRFGYRNTLIKTINIDHYRAIKTPLIDILQDLAKLTHSRLIIKKNSVIFTADEPFWKQYTVNYPNIKRSSLSKTQFNQSIGTVKNAQNTNASVEIKNEFKNEFWSRLEKLLTTLPSVYKSNTLIYNSTNQITQTPENTTILTHPETGLVSVYGRQSIHKQVKSVLSQVNQQAQRQAHIEIAIIEVELNDQYEAGIDWSLFENNNTISQQTLGSNLGTAPRLYTNITGVLDGISLNFGARLIDQFGTTKVLSSPQIRMINNQTALLKVVDNIVYFTVKTQTIQNTSGSSISFETQAKSIAVGIVITLTTNILPDDSLIINLKPTISRISNFINDPHPELAKNNIKSLIPILRERELESVLHIKSNEVAVIGGLIQQRDAQQSQQSPGSSGLLGFESKQQRNTELILFLRANLI